jgi:hypothetical protein
LLRLATAAGDELETECATATALDPTDPANAAWYDPGALERGELGLTGGVTGPWVGAARVPLGVNAPKMYEYEGSAGATTKYGSLAAILGDLDREGILDLHRGGAAEYASGDDPGEVTVDGLGVQFFRQPTAVDLTWPGDAGAQVAVPRELADDGTNDLEYESRVAWDGASHAETPLYWALYDRWWEPLRALFKRIGPGTGPRPLKVVLTLFTAGRSGDAELTDTPDPLAQLVGGNMIRLTFDPETHDDDVRLRWWDGVTLVNVNDAAYAEDLDPPVIDATGASIAPNYDATNRVILTDYLHRANLDWTGLSLDLRSRYKLYYIYLTSRAAARLLLDLQRSFNAEADAAAEPALVGTLPCGDEAEAQFDEAHSADAEPPRFQDSTRDPWTLYCRDGVPDVFASILAIEVFNEVNGNHLVTAEGSLPEKSTKLWARAVREAARGLHEELSGATDITVPAVDLWLPSLASYFRRDDDDSSTSPDFAQLQHWQDRFLAYLIEVTAEAEAAVTDASWLTWFKGQDYHYYHYKNDSGAGPIARLYHEVGTLQARLETFAADGAGLLALTMDTPLVSVCETGSSTGIDATAIEDRPPVETDETTPDGSVYPYVRERLEAIDTVYARDPIGLANAKHAFQETLQAREVWRRLGVALASGSSAVAWHSHMGTYNAPDDGGRDEDNGFSGTGLRQDYVEDDALPEEATRRPSWWALQRITRLLGLPTSGADLGGVTAAVRYLPRAERGGDRLDPYSFADMLVILEFSPTPYADYAYVLLLDPCADTSLGGSRLCVHNALGTDPSCRCSRCSTRPGPRYRPPSTVPGTTRRSSSRPRSGIPGKPR